AVVGTDPRSLRITQEERSKGAFRPAKAGDRAPGLPVVAPPGRRYRIIAPPGHIQDVTRRELRGIEAEQVVGLDDGTVEGRRRADEMGIRGPEAPGIRLGELAQAAPNRVRAAEARARERRPPVPDPPASQREPDGAAGGLEHLDLEVEARQQ